MSNGSNNKEAKNNQTTFIVGYRNVKYQGQISTYQRVPHGLGMCLDVNYQLVISHWREGSIQGQCVTITPQGNIFYGCIKNGLPLGLSCYQLSQQKFVYSLLSQKGEDLYLIDCCLSHTLFVVKASTILRNQIIQGHKDYKDEILQQYNLFQHSNPKVKKAIEILKEISYNGESEKWEKMESQIGQAINTQFKDFKSYLKFYFNTNIPVKKNRLQIIEAKQYVELRYKKTGIICRIAQDKNTLNKVMFVGYYDCYQQQSDVYRKNKGGIDSQIQQYCQGHSVCYIGERPTICQANILNYYRKSIIFVNNIVPIKEIYTLKKLYEAICSLTEREISSKFAQNQLENGGHQKDIVILQQIPHKQNAKEEQGAKKVLIAKRDLSNIQNKIYNRSKKQKDPEQSRNSLVSKLNYSRKKSYVYLDKPQEKQNQYNVSAKQTRFKEYLDDDNLQLKTTEQSRYNYSPAQVITWNQVSPVNKKLQYFEKSRKKYNYVDDVSSTHSYSRFKNEKNTPIKGLLEDHHLRSQKAFYNDQHNNSSKNLQKNYDYLMEHNESIGALTNKYQKIKNELKYQKKSQSKRQNSRRVSPDYYMGTPPKLSPSRYSNIRSPVMSPSAAYANMRRQWR